MEKKINYYNFADNDYEFLRDNYKEGRVSNIMCVSAQNICERYFKSVIEERANELGDTDIMKTHSLKRLQRFMEKNIPDFQCDFRTVVQADGYYFSARYPGEDSFFVEKEDVEDCWRAVVEAKKATDRYNECNRNKDLQKNDNAIECMEEHKSKLEDYMNQDIPDIRPRGKRR